MNKIKRVIYTFFPILVLKNSKYFDKEWYSKEYNININNAYKHYLKVGYKLGYDPSVNFSSKDYLLNNKDILNINPLFHYEMYGQFEGRRPFKHINKHTASSIKNSEINYDEIYKIIETKTVVSFDIFDTLINRPFVKASDLFKIIEIEYNVYGFYEARIKAEEDARKKLNKEVTIYEIYEFIDDEYKELIDVEIEKETKLCHINPIILPIYNKAKEENKRIIAISDMYFTKDIEEKILNKNGFNIKDIFVSCDYNKTKGSTELFKYVLNELQIDSKEVVHIGDNYMSDFVSANDVGIKGYKIPTIIQNKLSNIQNNYCLSYYKDNSNINTSILLSQFAGYLSKIEKPSFFEKLGYLFAGPLSFAYLNYVCNKAKENNNDLLLFVSRDGYLLKEIYNKYFYNIYKIDYAYAYLSRAVYLSSKYDEGSIDKQLKILKIYDSNITDYKESEDTINKLLNDNYENVKSHLINILENHQSSATVDMVTGKFTSYKFAKSILEDRLKNGYFAGSFKENNDACVNIFSKRILGMRDNLPVKISEMLITSFENSIIGVDVNNKPIYENNDNLVQQERYLQIEKGATRYFEDYFRLFNNRKELLFSFEEWLEFVNCYLLECPDEDIKILEEVIDSEAPISGIKDNKISDLINNYKKSGY